VNRLAPLMSSAKTDWGTPQSLFDAYNDHYRFTVDGAAHAGNAKLPRYFGVGGERPCGLEADWTGERVWLNPPYGRRLTKLWVEKAANSGAEVAVLLLPVRTDTRWFHENLYRKLNVQIEFIKGRIKFDGAKHGAPFPSLVATIWGQP
jgi:phage N-6-adenine-methyltransferase